MEKYIDKHSDMLLYAFNKSTTLTGKDILLFKDGTTLTNSDEYESICYSEDWESLLNFKVATKMRKKNQLLSYKEAVDLINEIDFGVLSFSHDDLPYSIGINHAYMDDKLYFHTGASGYKLHSLEGPASFIVIKDLGVNEEKSTHNHMSVSILGIMHQVSNRDVKLQVLQKLVGDLAPSFHREITESMVSATNILELDIKYMIGKSHIK